MEAATRAVLLFVLLSIFPVIYGSFWDLLLPIIALSSAFFLWDLLLRLEG